MEAFFYWQLPKWCMKRVCLPCSAAQRLRLNYGGGGGGGGKISTSGLSLKIEPARNWEVLASEDTSREVKTLVLF